MPRLLPCCLSADFYKFRHDESLSCREIDHRERGGVLDRVKERATTGVGRGSVLDNALT